MPYPGPRLGHDRTGQAMDKEITIPDSVRRDSPATAYLRGYALALHTIAHQFALGDQPQVSQVIRVHADRAQAQFRMQQLQDMAGGIAT